MSTFSNILIKYCRLFSARTSITTKCYSTTTKPLLRPRSKMGKIEPIGWFLLIIPASTFSLGVWQIQRKAWKEELLRNLKTVTRDDPVPLPSSLDEIDAMEYRPIRVRGTFLHDKELYMGPRSLLVKGNAPRQSGSFLQNNQTHGYVVVTPFKLEDRDKTILVNRGWVPAKNKDPRSRKNGQVEGVVDVIGIVRLNEKRPAFSLKNQQGSTCYFYRDLASMAEAAGTSPIFLDATDEFDVPEGPVGGQTRVSLRNEHMSYILTWFSLCAATSYLWYAKFLK